MLIWAGILLLSVIDLPAQNRIRGRVVDRNGAPRAQCQVEFNVGQQQRYRVYSDPSGYFFLDSPQRGTYAVVVSQGSRSAQFKVTVNEFGLSPAVLVVSW
jgi:hypothetical protein